VLSTDIAVLERMIIKVKQSHKIYGGAGGEDV
jgi:hypothetical protein